MRKKETEAEIPSCIHCHICQENCDFLGRYEMDLGDRERLGELAYHCFLCGTCTRVCPQGIDGRELVLNMRRNQAVGKGYGMLLAEKKNYLFRNYRHITEKCVLFPGCNFPSFYPKTTRKLVRLLKDAAGIGVVYDCCGKPVAELGMQEQEDKIAREIERRLQENGVEEVVMVCPNCYHFLKPKLSVRVVDIYEKLKSLGIGKNIQGGFPMFLPCPDRENRELLEHIQSFTTGEWIPLTEVQCCGLGGCAGVKEPELSGQLAKKAAGYTKGALYTYCGSCSGNLKRNGCADVRHVLAEILGVLEEPDTGRSMLNRVKTKFW